MNIDLIHSKRHRATVIVECSEGILLTEDYDKQFLLPGGGINRSELPIAAAARELMEETGLTAISLTFLFQHESVSTHHHVYYAVTRGTPIARDDALRIVYFDAATTSIISKMSPATRRILEKFKKIGGRDEIG